MPTATLAAFWIPQADWLYAITSSTGLLLVMWLVLRPQR
jgi:hypothetical protein